MWFGSAAWAAVLTACCVARARWFVAGGINRVPGPRRVVVSFQFVGVGLIDGIWAVGGVGPG